MLFPTVFVCFTQKEIIRKMNGMLNYFSVEKAKSQESM